MEPEVQKAGGGDVVATTEELAGALNGGGITTKSPHIGLSQSKDINNESGGVEPNADAAAEVLRQLSVNDSSLGKKRPEKKKRERSGKQINRHNLTESFSPTAELPPLRNARELQTQWNQRKPAADASPPLLRRIKMTQKGIRDRSKPTPEEEFWGGKVHRPYNLCSDVYVLPAPSPARGVEACIATLAPTAEEGKIPKSLQNLINFGKLGMLPAETATKTTEAEKIVNDNLKRQLALKPSTTPLLDSVESYRSISISELIQQARQQESSEKVVSTTKRGKSSTNFTHHTSHTAGSRIAMNPNLSSICRHQYSISKVSIRPPRITPSLPVFELPTALYVETPRS